MLDESMKDPKAPSSLSVENSQQNRWTPISGIFMQGAKLLTIVPAPPQRIRYQSLMTLKLHSRQPAQEQSMELYFLFSCICISFIHVLV